MVDSNQPARGMQRTYNQFVKAHELSNKFKCKRDFIKYFRECCKFILPYINEFNMSLTAFNMS